MNASPSAHTLNTAFWAAEPRTADLHDLVAPNGESADEVAEACGLRIVGAAIAPAVYGIYFQDNETIVLDHGLHAEARDFVLWHELGHYLVAHRYAPQVTRKREESFCDGFACVASGADPFALGSLPGRLPLAAAALAA